MSTTTTPSTKPGGKSPDLELVRQSILTVPSVLGVAVTTVNGELDGVRAVVDGSKPNKEVTRAIETVLLVDLDYRIDYRKIFAVARAEKSKTV